jgi:hypothetical protein
MITLALALLTPVAYNFPVGTTVPYDVQVRFDGFLPLFGGQEGKVDVQMTVEATGQVPDTDKNPQVTSELKTLELLFNGAKFPLGAENARGYFPKTTISMSPTGKILKTDAPDIRMMFRLPGLDVKRFPDITYLPIEFPAEGVEEGKTFEYRKPFGDSDVTYRVTPSSITPERITLKITVAQDYKTLEDVRLQIVDEEKGAEFSVSTHLAGDGTAVFDRNRGLVSEVEIKAEAVSEATNLKTGKLSQRRLATYLNVAAKPNRVNGLFASSSKWFPNRLQPRVH